MSKIHCESCGYIVQPIDRFCLKCGAPLKSTTTVAAEHTNPTTPELKQGSQTTPRRQGTRTAGLSKSRKRAPNVPWLIKAEAIGLLLIAAAAVVIFIRKGTNPGESGIPIPLTETSVPEIATLFPSTVTPLPPLNEEGLSNEQVMEDADKAFSSGLMAYLYDFQPETTSVTSIDSYALFSVRYILSKDAKEVPSIFFVQYVDLDGNSEFKRFTFLNDIDWNTKTGSVTFHKDPMTDAYDQALQNQGIEMNHVTPAYIEVILVGLEQQEDVTTPGSALSNVVRIQIVP